MVLRTYPKGMKVMAQFEFWANLDKKNDVIEIPDEVLEGLEGEALQDKILEYHIKWANKQIYGGWEKFD